MDVFRTLTEDSKQEHPPEDATIDWGRLIGVPVMILLLFNNVLGVMHNLQHETGSGWLKSVQVLASLLSVAFYGLLVAAFMRRTRARATHRSRTAAVVAFAASWLPFAIPLLPHVNPTIPLLVVSSVLLSVGLAFALWAIRFLDRSFSMLAQARAVVRTGPYAYVRHPLYTAEMFALLGTALARPGLSLAVWCLILGLQVYRARREEAILSQTLSDYADYQRTTPQLVPNFLRRRSTEHAAA